MLFPLIFPKVLIIYYYALLNYISLSLKKVNQNLRYCLYIEDRLIIIIVRTRDLKNQLFYIFVKSISWPGDVPGISIHSQCKKLRYNSPKQLSVQTYATDPQ